MKWEVVRSIVMKENIVQKLTSKDDKYACAFTDRIVAESHDTDAVSTLKNENGAKITLVSTLKKALIQKLFSVSAAGKNLKEKIFFVSTFLDKYKDVMLTKSICSDII